MIKKLGVYTGLCLLTLPILSFASLSAPATDSDIAQSGFFLGLGGSYNSVNVSQSMNGTGISNIYSGSTLVAYGDAIGPMAPYNDTQSTFAPEAQIGYFSHFNDSDYMWGVKYFYQYLGATSTSGNIDAPQTGTFTEVGSPSSTFTGNADAESTQLKTTNEMALMPFIGHSFKHSFVYLGAGPALFETQTKLNDLHCFADINGSHSDIGGAPINFSNDQWVWGGAAQIGLTYFLDPTWFVDFNYTYARSVDYDTNDSAAFASTFSGYNNSGTVDIVASQHTTVQTFAISINKVFA
ncbi:MAG: outer membrane beta-barrel protein [Legionellales bacterium]|nr:outer membrane beta-barrel protein [Legionellales bacterium]